MSALFAGSKILVTGGAGFIGSHIVERLVEERAEVTVLDNFSRGSLSLLSNVLDSVCVIEGDVRDRSCVEAASVGQTAVIHLASQSSVMRASADLDESFTGNVVGTFEVLRAAKSAGVKHCIFASSREVYGDPTQLPVGEDTRLDPKNPYGVSKLAGELYCRSFQDESFRVSILRLANVYGFRDFDRVIPIFVGQALRNEDLVLYGGGQILDFVWIDTVVDAFVAVAASKFPTGALNVGSGKGITIHDLARHIVRLSGSGSRVVVRQPRSLESVGFIADTTRAKQTLGIDFSHELLYNLPLLLESVSQPAPI
ncbi:MAG: NAD-dependent epimerase/dehydratase family protein [Acidobacteriaceae bacterium]|nr:NAD-dependent epimerase/dehydratase family protein [Acidobacteriaceae bacterium]